MVKGSSIAISHFPPLDLIVGLCGRKDRGCLPEGGMGTRTGLVVGGIAHASRVRSAWHGGGALTYFLGLMIAVAVPAACGSTMYVTAGTQSVFQINSAGVARNFSTLPFNGGAEGLAIDARGNLYVANELSHAISKVSTSGSASLFGTVDANFYPFGLAFGPNGDLFAADDFGNRIIEFTPKGPSLFSYIPDGASSSTGLAFDSSGNLYVAALTGSKIVKITPNGTTSFFASLPTDSLPFGLAFDSRGNLYVSDAGSGQIIKITPSGGVTLFATVPSNSFPEGLAFDPGGNLFVAEYQGNRIDKVTPDGLTVSTFATGIFEPHYIAFSPPPAAPMPAAIVMGLACFTLLAFGKLLHRPSAPSPGNIPSLPS
jgi:outer membrane protein assembly factor BamB